MGQTESNISHCTNLKKFSFSFLFLLLCSLGGFGWGLKTRSCWRSDRFWNIKRQDGRF